MTVVVAFVTAEAAVMASDTEGTESDQTRRDVDKIWSCGPVLLGYTGTSVIQQPLRAALDQTLPNAHANGPLDRWNMRKEICAAAAPVLQSAYASRVPRLPPQIVPPELMGTLLVVGRDKKGFWLIEVNENNNPTFYDDGFHAVGSGSVAAKVSRGLLGRYEPIGRSLAHLRLIAYRTIAGCIGVLGGTHGVGGSVRMWCAQGTDPFAEVDERTLQSIRNGVGQWTTIEAESLDRVVFEEADPLGTAMPEALEAAEAPVPKK